MQYRSQDVDICRLADRAASNTAETSHLLIVDDSSGVCTVVSEYLSQYDFRVTCVGTGKQMMEILGKEAITKPFSPRELLARIRAVLGRTQVTVAPPGRDETLRAYRFEGWELNVRLHRLTSPTGTRVPISRGDFSLLCAFLSSPRQILTRDQLLELSRLHSTEVYDRSIDVQILRLRRKIEADPAHPTFVRTERGAGYYFDAAVNVVR